jgi:hypothetical protein
LNFYLRIQRYAQRIILQRIHFIIILFVGLSCSQIPSGSETSESRAGETMTGVASKIPPTVAPPTTATHTPLSTMTATHTPSPTATIAPTATATPIPLPVVSQWGIFELELTSDQSYNDTEKFQDVTLLATFTGPEGTSYEVHGFWDGDNTWRIRFAPPVAGEWAYTVTSTDSDLNAVTNDGAFLAEAMTAAQIATNPNWRGFLRVSDNGRYLTYADGTPFFWLGDTIWRGNQLSMAFERDPDDAGPNVAEFPAYVTNRQAKGFTVIQMVAGYPNDPDIVNEGGSTYLEPYTTINPAYFQWLDKRIDLIVAQGMVPVIVGQWHEAVNDMPLPALKGYWDYLLARYQAHNVVWVTVGEYG